MKEFDFIETIKNSISDPSLIGDDTACIDGLILTQDTLVEDVHFRLSTISPYDLGIKSVAVNLSDIAAAGGVPKYILISLSTPRNIDNNFVAELYKGIDKICTEHNTKIAGGDITGGDKVSITVSAIAHQEGFKPASRSFAKEGDIIAVTGNHGSSRTGLELLEKGHKQPIHIIKAHTTPTPRVEEGRTITKNCIMPAMMDTSDGLADALFKIGKASNVTLNVNFDNIPYDEDIKDIATYNFKNWVLFGGEDYELVVCITENELDKLKRNGLILHKIGYVSEKKEAPAILEINSNIFNIDEEALSKGAYDHFKENK